MTRFRFSLDRLLWLREQRESECRIELGRVIANCSRLRNGITAKEREHSATLNRRGIGGSLEYLFASEQYMYRVREEVAKLGRELKEAEADRERAMGEYLAASRSKKVLEKLRERRVKEYEQKRRLEEGALLDELIGGRRGMGDGVSGEFIADSVEGDRLHGWS